MSVKLLTEHHLEFLNLKGGRTGSSESELGNQMSRIIFEYRHVQGGKPLSNNNEPISTPLDFLVRVSRLSFLHFYCLLQLYLVSHMALHFLDD